MPITRSSDWPVERSMIIDRCDLIDPKNNYRYVVEQRGVVVPLSPFSLFHSHSFSSPGSSQEDVSPAARLIRDSIRRFAPAAASGVDVNSTRFFRDLFVILRNEQPWSTTDHQPRHVCLTHVSRIEFWWLFGCDLEEEDMFCWYK